MTDVEQNGAVHDEELQSPILNSKPSTDADDFSNNSVQAKDSSVKGKGKSPRGKKDSSRRKQSVRQAEFIEKQKQNGIGMDGRAKTFISHLLRPSLDGRDIKSKVFKNQIMLSEGLDEVPNGFAKNWIMLVCPVGSRCLVVASKGHTGAYTKSGYHIISHPSSLPMGNMMCREVSSGPCVLDCIYCNDLDTYFVLDLMCWDGQPLFDCDTQTRQRLLHDRVREFNLNRPSHLNPYPIMALKSFTPTKSNICAAVREAPYIIDGLLFLHKQLKYVSGPNPLSLWLTLDRLPLKMKIEIPDLGIVATHNYTDPVALAMAHGISPAIISQAFPPSPRGQHNQRHGYQQNAGGRPFYHHHHHQQQQHHHHHHHPHPQQHQPPHQRPQQHPQGGWPANRGGPPNSNGMGYLAEMMAGMNMNFPARGGEHGPHMYAMNMNNSSMHLPPHGGRYHQDHFQFRKDGRHGHDFYNRKREKKNMKKAGKPRRPDQPKKANWEQPHGVMKSQWIGSEKPERFEDDYLTCICPMSKRRILVATGGSTCSYNKYGKLVDTFFSNLPNGSKETVGDESTDLTILDTLWCGSTQKFMVIDVMHWQQKSFYEVEADYRFAWLADNFTSLTLKSGQREFSLELLPKYASHQPSITTALTDCDYKVDGLLCFKKQSIYSKTATVNALWLKLDMMEAFLGYPPPEEIHFKPTTEKERKQRDYFIELGAKKEEEKDDDTQEGQDN